MPDLVNTLLIALALAMDAFAVAIALGMVVSPLTGRHVFRLSFHFGLFQFLMVVVGSLAGETLSRLLHGYEAWVAFGLLTLIGAKMIYESWSLPAESRRGDPTRGLSLIGFSIAVSIDALAAGVTMALLNRSVWQSCIVVGVVAGLMSWGGIIFGNRLGRSFSRWAERFGGLVLIALGLITLLASLK